jgi:hypothetical protein
MFTPRFLHRWLQTGEGFAFGPKRRRPMGRFRPLTVEPLENRLLLSVSHLVPVAHETLEPPAETSVPESTLEQPGVAQQAVSKGSSSAAVPAAPPGLSMQFQLQIVGTGIEFDPASGLPSRLEGDMYFVGGRHDGDFAGTYQETVTPILHPEYGFVGTVGVVEFSFQHPRAAHGKLTIHSQSLIMGLADNGAMQVESEGTIIEGTKRLREMTGGFASSSTVLLGLEFSMDVQVDLSAVRALPFNEPLSHQPGHGTSPTAPPMGNSVPDHVAGHLAGKASSSNPGRPPANLPAHHVDQLMDKTGSSHWLKNEQHDLQTPWGESTLQGTLPLA